MNQNLVEEINFPIFGNGWIVKIFKEGAFSRVQGYEGGLSLEEKEVINDIIFDPSFTIKLQNFVDTMDSNKQTKKDAGIKLGIFCSMRGIKTKEIAEKFISLVGEELDFKRKYILEMASF